jgi:TRAP-type C4-dicarboxylate transport system permease small subunit
MTPIPLSARAARGAAVLACVAVAALLLLALATTTDVLLRYAFARPLRGFVDIASLSGAVLLAACMPHVLARRGNINVDALGRHLGRRWNRWLDRFAACVTAAFFAVMAWQYLRFALDLKSTAQTIAVLRWPVWPWWLAVAALVVVAAGVGFATAWTSPEHAS